MSSFDQLLLAATALSGLLWLGYALFRYSADEQRQKIVKFWQEIFLLCGVVAAARLFYAVFPAVPPEQFFFGCTLAALLLYGYFKIARRHDTAERKKVVKLCRDAFFCLLAVFLLRAFYVDWFRIPSNSMLPTLTVGDIVLTDKNHYGVRLPILNTRLSAGAAPARGDIIVFKKPGGSLFYIKRIVGIPGDVVRYGDDKQLTINGAPAALELLHTESAPPRLHLKEALGGGWHELYLEAGGEVLFRPPDAEHCRLSQSAAGYILECTVPPRRYFVLGDNRDRSNDSRFWGFVPEESIVGPARRVIFNHRIVTDLQWRQRERFWLPLALEEK